MDDESISFVASDAFSKLLQSPIGSWMSGDIEVKNTSSCDFNNDEDIDQLKGCRDNDEEVTGDDGIRMVAHEGHPALLWVRRPHGRLGHVATDGAR